MAVTECSSASFQVQLKAAFQRIRTTQAKNPRLQSTSFRLEASLQQCISKDLGTSVHQEQFESAILCTQYGSSSSEQRPMVVIGGMQHHTGAEGTHDLEDTTLLGQPSLELMSGLCSNDSVSFIPVVTVTLAEKAPGRRDSKFYVTSIQAHTEEPQDAVAAALLATVPSPRPLQPPSPVAAVASPFAAYSQQAFSDCSGAESKQQVSDKALLSSGSAVGNSTAGKLLTSLSAPQAGGVESDLSLSGRLNGLGRCDHWLSDKLCHSLSSTVSASSLMDDSTDYRPELVCAEQQHKGMGRYTLAVWQKGDDVRPHKHRVFRRLGNALGTCFCSSTGSAL